MFDEAINKIDKKVDLGDNFELTVSDLYSNLDHS